MRKTRLTIIAAAALAACVAVLLLARWQFRDRSLDRFLEGEVLRVGYAVEAPHAFLLPGGEVSGLSPELARRVAGELGLARVEWRLAEFDALLAELEEGRVDVVAAGMFITPARSRRVAFTEPFFHVRQALLVAAGNPLGLHSYRDVKERAKARVAVLSGSVEQAMLLRLGLPPARTLPVPDARAGLAAVVAGEAEALALSSPSIKWMVRSAPMPGAEMATPFEQPGADIAGRTGYGAFALRKADKALLRAWNAAQAKIMAGKEYVDLLESFGFEAGELPGGVSAAEVAGQ